MTAASRSTHLTFALLRKFLRFSACASYFSIQKRVAQTHNVQHSTDMRILKTKDLCSSCKSLFATTKSWRVGCADGLLVGWCVGSSVGWLVGWSDGRADGRSLGLSLGSPLGWEVGWSDGWFVSWLVSRLDDWCIGRFPDTMVFWLVDFGASSAESKLEAMNSPACNGWRSMFKVADSRAWDIEEGERSSVSVSAFSTSGCKMQRSCNSPASLIPESNPLADATTTLFDLPTSSSWACKRKILGNYC